MNEYWKNNKKNKQLRKLLIKETGCGIQDGFPCNTCFHTMDLGIDSKKLHELWGSQLLIRNTGYERYVTQTPEQFKENIDLLIDLLKGDKNEKK